jgi:WD40 repeat protein
MNSIAMWAVRWLALIWVLVCFGSISTAAEAQDVPILTRIGRGAIQNVAWHPSGDYILVSTVTGAWIYTPDLQDLAYLPDANLAALSPDGRYIAGVNAQHQLLMWDGITFEPVETGLVDRFQRIETLAWSPDGRYLAVSSFYGTHVYDSLENWNLVLGAYERGKLSWSSNSAFLVIYTPSEAGLITRIEDPGFPTVLSIPADSWLQWQDEKTFLVVSPIEFTYYITRWDALTGKRLSETAIPGFVFGYSHDGGMLVNIRPDKVRISSTESIADQRNFEIYKDVGGYFANILSWSPNNRMIAFGIANWQSHFGAANLLIIDTENQRVVNEFTDVLESVRQIIWSYDSRYLLVVDERQQLLNYDMGSGELVAATSYHTLVGETLAWNSTNTQIAIGGSLEAVTLWDIPQNGPVAVLNDNGSLVTSIHWQPIGERIAFETTDSLEIWNPPAGFQLWEAKAGDFINITEQLVHQTEESNTHFAWSGDGTHLAVSIDSNLHMFDVSGEIIQPVGTRDLNNSPVGLFLNSDGSYLGVNIHPGASDGYTPYTNSPGNANPHLALVQNGVVAWSYAGEMVSLSHGTIRRRDTLIHSSAVDVIILNELFQPVDQSFLSPRGTYAGMVDESASGMIWDAQTGELIAGVPDAAQMVWSPDETRLVVQRQDGGIWLMESDGTILTQFPISPSVQEPVGSFYWSPDGTQIAHLHDGVIDLWMVGN